MRLHSNARSCPRSRRLMIARLDGGWTLAEVAAAAGVSVRTVSKWRARWRLEGEDGLVDRSSAPKRVPHRTSPDRVRVIEQLRRLRMTATEIAEVLAMALSTVSAILKRIGLGKRSRLEPLEPIRRYECARPGELLHIDVKKLARFKRAGHRALGRGPGRFHKGAGYEYLHVCVDDHTRLAYAELHPNERPNTAIAFLTSAPAFYNARGISPERVLTDNGNAHISHAWQDAIHNHSLRHTRTRPRHPQTNGKAERFIQTLLTEWAYARIYTTSTERATQLHPYLNHYNYNRPHGSLNHQPPATRLNNAARNYN